MSKIPESATAQPVMLRIGWFLHDSWRICAYYGTGNFGHYYSVIQEETSLQESFLLLAITSQCSRKTKDFLRSVSIDFGILPDGCFFFITQQIEQHNTSSIIPKEREKIISDIEDQWLISLNSINELMISAASPVDDDSQSLERRNVLIGQTFQLSKKPPIFQIEPIILAMNNIIDFSPASALRVPPELAIIEQKKHFVSLFIEKGMSAEEAEWKVFLSFLEKTIDEYRPRVHSLGSQFDDTFAQLDIGWIAVDAPGEMIVGCPGHVCVSAIRKEIEQALMESNLRQENTQLHKTRLGPIVKIELFADDPGDFSVDPMSIPKQPVLSTELTIWEWLVTPRRSGERKILRVVATNYVDVNGRLFGKRHPVRIITLRVLIRTSDLSTKENRAIAQSRVELRKSLLSRLRTDADFDAWCIDYFPEVSNCFAPGMNRMEKCTTLIKLTSIEEIAVCLEEDHPALTRKKLPTS